MRPLVCDPTRSTKFWIVSPGLTSTFSVVVVLPEVIVNSMTSLAPMVRPVAVASDSPAAERLSAFRASVLTL